MVNIYYEGYELIDWKNTSINRAKLESSDIYIIFRSFLCESNIQPGSRCFSISGDNEKGTGANPSDNESVDERRNIKGYGTIFSPSWELVRWEG